MYSDMIGDSVTILVATKGDTVQEYRGILIKFKNYKKGIRRKRFCAKFKNYFRI